MKSYELMPTYINLFETYKKNTIGRNADIFYFIDILNNIEDGCAIALDGNWGSGKTFFVKQVKMVLDANNNFTNTDCENDKEEIIDIQKKYRKENNSELKPQVCVYYDAWENDNDDDPVMSLIYTILNSVESDFTFKHTDCVKIGASIMEVFTGKNWSQLIENLKGKSPLEKLKEHKEVGQLVDEFLNTLLEEKGERLVVIVDELDRCKPSYAIRLLERIKHYFHHDRLTFVFSINTNELQHTIKKYYGNDFNGSRYLERFFDLRITLPPADLNLYLQTFDYNDSHYMFDMVCGAVIKSFHFELREIAKYLRLTKIAAYDLTHNSSKYDFSFSEGRGNLFILLTFLPVMLGLKIQDTEKYTKFISGKDGSALFEIAKIIDNRYFDDLMADNESYDITDTDKTSVSINEKLQQVYEAVFCTVYDYKIYQKTVGHLTFNSNTQKLLIRIESLLSPYTMLDIE